MNLAARFAILQRDHFRCTYCGQNPAADPAVILEVDHIWPQSRGGTDHPDNLTTSCKDCNRGKSDRVLTITPEFVQKETPQNENRPIDVGSENSPNRENRKSWESEIDRIREEKFGRPPGPKNMSWPGDFAVLLRTIDFDKYPPGSEELLEETFRRIGPVPWPGLDENGKVA